MAPSVKKEEMEESSASASSSDSTFKSLVSKFAHGSLRRSPRNIKTEQPLTRVAKVVKRVASPKKAKSASREERAASAEEYRELGVPDNLGPDMILLFCGANPGIKSGKAGHAFSHPTNRFWKMLHHSGITPTQLRPEDDVTLPERYNVGRTDLILRVSRREDDIPPSERAAATRELDAKVAEYRPEAICFVSKGTWAIVHKAKHGKALNQAKFSWGWQKGERMGRCKGFEGARVFVIPSTSGLVTEPTRPVQAEIWEKLGRWVNERRAARMGMKAELNEDEDIKRELMEDLMDDLGEEAMVKVEVKDEIKLEDF